MKYFFQVDFHMLVRVRSIVLQGSGAALGHCYTKRYQLWYTNSTQSWTIPTDNEGAHVVGSQESKYAFLNLK